MTASADTRKGRTEAYERMRVSEDRVRALRGQSALMKQSLKSAKKSGSRLMSINDQFAGGKPFAVLRCEKIQLP